MNDKQAYDKLKQHLLATSQEAWHRYPMATLMADDLGVQEHELSGILLQCAVKSGFPDAWKESLLESLRGLNDVELARLVRERPILVDAFREIGFQWSGTKQNQSSQL